MTTARESMSIEDYAEFLAFGNREGTEGSPVPGEFIHDFDGKIWFVSGGGQCVGDAFCQWHSGTDAVYAVGSSTIANVGVDCEILQNAVDLLKRIDVFESEYDRVERDWLVELSETALQAIPSEDIQMVFE